MDTNLQVSGNEDPSRISINTTKGDNLGDLYIEKIVYDDEGVYVCIVTSPKSSRESYDVSVVGNISLSLSLKYYANLSKPIFWKVKVVWWDTLQYL